MELPFRVETFKGRGDQPWYLRLVSTSNGQTMFQGEGYSRKGNRDRAVKRLKKALPGLKVDEVTPEP